MRGFTPNKRRGVAGAEGVGFEPTETRNASPVVKTVRSNAVTRQNI